MISHTIRYIKLMYIVIGILISNDAVCETIDEIQIAAHVSRRKKNIDKLPKATIKPSPISNTNKITYNNNNNNNNCNSNSGSNSNNINDNISSKQGSIISRKIFNTTKAIKSSNRLKCWLPKFNRQLFYDMIKNRLHSFLYIFNIWTIPGYFVEYSTKLFHRKLIISSDCDMIYK